MKWQLKDKEFQSFRNLKHCEYLKCSNNFILSVYKRDVTFSLLCFPSGHDSKHKGIITFQLYTSSVDAIPSDNILIIRLSIILQQVSFKQSITLQFHQKQLHQYIATKMLSEELNGFSDITFHWNIHQIDDLKHDETPIKGREIKNTNTKTTLRLDISPSSSSTIDTKTIWQIKPAQIPLLINRVGYMLWSDIFIVEKFDDGIKFQLQVKNNLNNKYPHSMSILLHLLQLPQNIKTVTCSASIICIECKTRSYGVFDMTLHESEFEKSINLLRPYSLEIYELQNIKTLTCICEIEILKLISFSTDVHIKQPFYLKQSKNYNQEIKNYEWRINDTQLLKFKNAVCGKVFCGPKYDIWYLKVSPNGFLPENKGSVQLDVCNLYMPPEYYKIIAYVTLRCKEISLSINDTVEFTLRNRFYSWPIDTLKRSELLLLSQITFLFDMKIIKMCTKTVEKNESYRYQNKQNNFSKYTCDTFYTNDTNTNTNEVQQLKQTVNQLKAKVNQLEKQINTLLAMNYVTKPCNLSQWLTSLNLQQYIVVFSQHGYDDFISMSELTHYELNQIGIQKKGHRIKILKNIAKQSVNMEPGQPPG